MSNTIPDSNLNYLLLDKDETLGIFPLNGFYPLVESFLNEQVEEGRKLVIATTDKRTSTLRDLKPIDQLIYTYFTRENFRAQSFTEIKQFYIDALHGICDVEKDYAIRGEILPLDERRRIDEEYAATLHLKDTSEDRKMREQSEQRLQDIRSFLNQMVHRETQQLFDVATLYQNPYDYSYVFKDLHLIRLYLVQEAHATVEEHATLRTVMIGDMNDGIATPQSDPFTPVIVINNSQRCGNWQPVTDMLHVLYENLDEFPWQQFDGLYEMGIRMVGRREGLDREPIEISGIRLYNQRYELDRGNKGRRIVIQE